MHCPHHREWGRVEGPQTPSLRLWKCPSPLPLINLILQGRLTRLAELHGMTQRKCFKNWKAQYDTQLFSYHNPWNYCFKNYRCFLPIWFTHMRFHLLYLWKENAFWSPRDLLPGCWQAAAAFDFSCSARCHYARQYLPFPWWKWKRKVIEEKSIMGKLRTQTDFSLLFKIISKRLELHALSLNKCK